MHVRVTGDLQFEVFRGLLKSTLKFNLQHLHHETVMRAFKSKYIFLFTVSLQLFTRRAH